MKNIFRAILISLLVLSGLRVADGAAIGPAMQIVYPQLAPFFCKFDDTTDDTACLQAAINSITTPNTQSVVSLPPNSTTKINGQITIDVSKVRLDCNGTKIDATGNATVNGSTFNITTTNTSANQMGMIHDAHPVTNCFLYGPDFTSDVDAFHFTPIMLSGTPWLIGIVLDGVSGTGFRNFIQTSDGMVGFTVMNGQFGGDVNGSQTFMDVAGYDNAGENFRVVNYFLANLGTCFNDHFSAGSDVDIYVTNVSCDVANYVLTGGPTPGTGASEMTVNWIGHIEDIITSTNYPINIANGGLIFSGNFRGSSALSHVLCNVATPSSVGAIGVRFTNVQFDDTIGTFAPQGSDSSWCDGSGGFSVTGSGVLGNTVIGLFAPSNNLVGFNTNPQTSQWNISGTVTSDTSTKPSGATSSLKLVANGGQSSATLNIPCRPGQIGALGGVFQTSGIAAATGGQWGMQLTFIDSKNNSTPGGTSAAFTTDLNSFTQKTLFMLQELIAPGTQTCQITYFVQSTSGAVDLWVGYPEFILQ